MELLVRIIDQINPSDARKSEKRTKRGDVVHVAPDGWEWSPRERTNPEWVILRVPISRAEAEAFLVVDKPAGKLLRKRLFHVDLDALGITERTAAIIHVEQEKLRQAKRLKEPYRDPNVIDPRPRVIG